MEAGKLNRRIRIDWMDPNAQDAFGQPVPAWVEIATVWAGVVGKSGKQAILSDAPVSEVQVSIRVRYRPGVNAGMRATLLRYENRMPVGVATYDIKAVMHDEACREYTDLVCLLVGNTHVQR